MLLQSFIKILLGFRRRHVADGLQQAAVVEPVNPFEGGEFDGLEGVPRAAPMDDLRFEETVDGFRQSVVIAVADAADGGYVI